MKLKVITPIIALRHSNEKASWLSNIVIKIIKFVIKSEYYHTELIVNDKWITADYELGVVVYDLEKFDHTEWVYKKLPVTMLTEEQYDNFWMYTYTQVGKKYDYNGIFLSQLIKIGKHNKNKWFCSELSVKLLQILGYPDFVELYPEDMSPGDIDRLVKE